MTADELEPARTFRIRHAAKGDYLARAGHSATGSAFILNGLVRQVFVSEDGRERVNAFAAEDTLVCTYRAFLTTQLPDLSIQALAPTWYLAIPRGYLDRLTPHHPGWRELVARLTEAKFVAAELRTRTLLLDDATERYRVFREEFAELADRIPLAQVAAYIGITPEALSRIRRRNPASA